MAETFKWRALDSKKLNQPVSENIAGVMRKSYVSPYDVPEAIGVHKDSDSCHVIVEFKYIGEEETLKSWSGEDAIELWLGDKSKRLCKIEFDLREDEPEEVNRAIDKLSQELQRPPRQGNYELAKKALLSIFNSPEYPDCKTLADPAV